MKKQSAALLILLLAVAVLTGCGGTPAEKQKVPEFEVSKINLNLGLKKSEQETVTYSDGRKAIFCIRGENEDDFVTGASADRFVVYDIAGEKIDKEYVMDEGVYGKSAIPYKEGLLYSCYQVDRKDEQHYHWQIIYQEGDKKTVIDQGEEESGFQESLLAEGDAIYYTFKDRTDEGHCGIRKFDDGKIVTIAEYDDMYAAGIKGIDNGVCYVSMFNANGAKYSAIDGNKVIWEQKLDVGDSYTSSVANDEYFLCWQNGSEKKGLSAIDIKRGRVIESDIQLKEPSFTAVGDYFLIEDQNKNQYYAVVRDNQITVEELKLPEMQKYKLPLGYSISAGENSAILMAGDYWDKRRDYYFLELK